jgi:hypothetical protein
MGKRQLRISVPEANTKLSQEDLPLEVQVVTYSGITHFGLLKSISQKGITVQLPLNKNLQIAADMIEELVFDIETQY